MFRVLISSFLFLSLLSCLVQGSTPPFLPLSGKMVAPDSPLVVLTYGLPRSGGQHARVVVAERYGFRYRSEAGCLVSKELVDRIDRHNRDVYALLGARHGPGWEKKFEADVERLFRLEEEVKAFVRKEPYFVQQEKEQAVAHNGLDLLVEPTTDENVFRVKAQGWGLWKGKTEWLIFFRVTVNRKTGAVTRMGNQVEKA